MEKGKKLRKITKFRHSIKAISPIISALLLIAIAVVASLIAYAWIMGYIGGSTTKSGNAIIIQGVSYTSSGNLTIYVQNTGQGVVHLKQDGSVYVNNVLQQITQCPPVSGSNAMNLSPGQLIPIGVGKTVSIVINCLYHVGDTIKIVTVEGASVQFTGTGSSGSSNLPPVASFTVSPTAPTINQNIAFKDTSITGNGINQWAWSFGDGSTSTSQNPTHTYTTLGSKTVILTVTDLNGKASTISKSLTVSDYISPVALFTYSPLSPGIGTQITFTDKSTPGSGTINQWAWSFGGGSTSTSQNPTHTYTTSGQYTVSLTVTNTNSKTSTVSSTINVAYIAPTAQFTLSTANPNVGQTVTFTDTSVPGTTGTINQWSWNFGDGTTSTTQNPTHAYTTPGSKTVTLTVTDTNSKTSTATQTLTVNAYTSPAASFTFIPILPNAGDTVTFTDTSTSGSGTINQWSWNFGDGTTSTTQNPTHAYSASGQETVSLTVTDSNSKTSTTTQTIQVSPNPSSSPNPTSSPTPTSNPTNPPVGQVQVTFAVSPSGSGSVNPSGTKTYTTPSSPQISATANTGYTFSSWTFSGSMQIASSTSASTTATINGAGTITANFISSTSNKLVFTAGTNQALLVKEPSQKITVQRQTSSGSAITSGSLTVSLTATSGGLYSDQYCTSPASSVTISSGSSSASFYYMATATDTPTITATASNYASVSTTFTITNPSSVTTISATTNFDGSNWESGWDNWSNPPWTVCTDNTHVFSAPASATSNSGNAGPFSSNAMDATGAKYITVTFEFMVYQTSSDSLQIRYSGTATSGYQTNMWTTLGSGGNSLGSTTTYPGGVASGTSGGTWHQYTATITDTSAFTTSFRLSFLSQDMNSRSQVWVDNIVVTVYK